MSRELQDVKRIVLKVGTNLLSSKDGIDELCIDSIVEQIALLMQKNYQVLLVTSGAIGMGAKELHLKGPVKQVAMRQACASIGQPLLMSSYRRAFKKHGLVCSQILLTRKDLNNRHTYVNLRNSVFTLLELGVIPIFNENDVVSTAEIGSAFGDNDRMSAMVASKIDADLLIILTDIPGLYTADPKKDSKAELLSEIEVLDEDILAYAGGAGSTYSTGGMKTKLLAAKIAAVAGCATIIASGYEKNALLRLMEAETLGTYIHPAKRLSQRERWILNNSHQGSIEVDDGAKQALLSKKSLLPKGVVRVHGVFSEGDVIQVCSADGKPFAKAVPYLNSTDIASVAGHSSKDIQRILGTGYKDMIFRPEDLVLLDDVE
ncbi:MULTISPECIES: glutamate 5-kinase [Sphaerochaeta]|jgi:glutamate 5-kinase|uniref:Glutamate 5-kinase n=1 Tax=bioreactor metagenome TaxID=1076179 RepID=A0A644W4X4_9ZZZZ|nr:MULTISPECIES: glutamate 5-kinase [Sphaerochaeta]MDT3358293.1 glutamate 5-kinase [Spirochaetota bacterium]MDD2394160.1 glutamate 5-kinase [Sphaerochaeta sp.]MDD3423594.1 glutamate 5-kinase [Sphaerochaeta sp.]MDD3456153.1 glutamate 5-kinase [Sphaerochaeta sp.]MDD4036888.1 glutamate 5-kinase [Sphaerochaeta sp.]